MTADRLQGYLTRLGACSDGIEWAAGKSLEDAWQTCGRSAWLAWLAGLADTRLGVRAAVAAARAVQHFWPSGDDRPRRAVEAAEAWLTDPSDAARAACDAYAVDARRAALAFDVFTLGTLTAYGRSACASAAAAAFAASQVNGRGGPILTALRAESAADIAAAVNGDGPVCTAIRGAITADEIESALEAQCP